MACGLPYSYSPPQRKDVHMSLPDPKTIHIARAQSSLEQWFPALLQAGVPVPRTEIIATDVELMELLDGKMPAGFNEFAEQLKAAAAHIGYPVFLRTGQGSGKHEWARTCFVPTADDLLAHVVALVEWSEMVDFIGLASNVWVVREFLPLASKFTAFDGTPITVERRYFIKDGRVLCHHPYWPVSSIRRPSVSNWRTLWDEMNQEDAAEVAFLTEQSARVSHALPGEWSLDWALGTNGVWYAIDIAVADLSYHWPTCPHAPSVGYPSHTFEDPMAEMPQEQ